MSFDLSRVTFDPWRDFSSVAMEQGRVQLDSDWNEWLAELTRRIRAGTLDTLGRAVYPATTPNAFLITPTAGSLSIGVGRMYVDGLLVENHGLPAPGSGGWIPPNVTPPAVEPAWDPALDELVGQNPLDYLQQPYFPGVSIQAPFPTTGGPFLVYLDIWQREVTFLEYPDLIEKAVGVDTTGRLQTVWQVRLVDISSSGNVTCETKDGDITAWNNLIQPSAGRLTTGVVPSSPSGPCCLAPNTGFTGMENQLYRVEIHQGGVASTSPAGTASSQLPAGTATFKWSRNNSSVATAVTGISQAGMVLTVQSTGKDDVLRFSANDWVEITDDWLELNGQHGELHQVHIVTDSANTIELFSAVTAATFPVDANGLTDPKRHTRLIKWDQKGKVYESDGTTVWTDLDAAGTGEIPVPPPGTALILENGATVSFDLTPGIGGVTSFKVDDYWNVAARTVDGTIENLIEAPPRGIHHHYARLAMLPLNGSPSDCRVEWPPTTGGCDCTSCVTADSHNGNIWTIQQAIDAVQAEGGGKVCLGPGVYNIASTITIGVNTPAQNLAICGHGLPTLTPTAQFEGGTIMLIQNAIDIDVDYLAFSCGPPNPAGGVVTTAALTIQGSSCVCVEHCVFGLATDTAQLSPAIALVGPALLDCALRENLFNNARVAVGLGNTDVLLLKQFKVEDNQMFCSDGAVFLASLEKLVASEIRFANNFVECVSGFVLQGTGLDVAIEDNTFSIVSATPPVAGAPYHAAVVCNISQTRVTDNEITRRAVPLIVNLSANNNGGLTTGSYTWVVTALDVQGRERVVTSFESFDVPSESNATLTWSAMAGATGYNVYRSVVNGATLLLDGSLPQSSSETVSYSDTVADGNLQNQQLPAMQNDGILIGAVTPSGSVISKTQVTGNRITGLTGAGVLASNAFLSETLVARNQLSNLGGNGISLGGQVFDVDVMGNSLLSVGQLAVSVDLVAIKLPESMRANVSENRIEGLGPATVATGASYAIYVVSAYGARIAGNRIAKIGLSTTASGGIAAEAFGRLDVADNEVLRGNVQDFAGKDVGPVFTAQAQSQANIWLALDAIGFTVSVEGNLLESEGGKPALASAVKVLAFQSSTFSNNQCYLDFPDPKASVVQVESRESIIAMGNRVKGPNIKTTKKLISPPSMALLAPTLADPKIPAVTVIGNITSMGIDVPPGMPAAMAPLNIEV